MTDMRMIRVYRVNGDCLSCRFNPDRSLSTAMLVVAGRQRNVAPQLPGITSDKAEDYLSELGYVREYPEKCRRVGYELNLRLRRYRLLVETVRETDRGLLLSVVDLRFAFYACPARLFAGLLKHNTFNVLHVNSEEALATFRTILAH